MVCNNRKHNIMKFIGIIALQIIILAGIAYAMPVVEWSRTYGGAGSDEDVLSVQQTKDGGYILAGKQQLWAGDSAIGEKALLIKTDANGNELWIRTFGENWSGASSVQKTRDGGYILTGYTTSSERGENIWLIKTDENGNLLWSKEFGGKAEDRAISVQQIKDGGFILIGYKTYEKVEPEPLVYRAGDIDIWLIKTDENGNEQWNRLLGGTSTEKPSSVTQTSDGGFIISAWTSSYGDSNINGWLVKTDNNGIELWNRTFSRDLLSSVLQIKDGGYILSGYSMFGFSLVGLHINIVRSETWLIRTDADGNTLWKKTFGGYMAWSVQQTMDSGYILAGNRQDLRSALIGGDKHVWILKTDADGNEMWTMTPGGKNYIASSVRQTEDGGYVIAGSTDLYAMGRKTDAWLIKVSGEPDGTASPNQTLAAVQAETSKITPTQKAAGFEAFLAITILLAISIVWRKKR